MRGAFVAQRHAAALACVPLSFALHQHVDPAVQRYDFSFLPRYDIRQIVDDTGQMGNLFFKFFHSRALSMMRRVWKWILSVGCRFACPSTGPAIEAGRVCNADRNRYHGQA